MSKPGIMLYFDMSEPLKFLSDAEKGKLLMAALEYGQYGTAPAFDGVLAVAWGFVKPKLDRDNEAYDETKLQRQYAAFCKKRIAISVSKSGLHTPSGAVMRFCSLSQ